MTENDMSQQKTETQKTASKPAQNPAPKPAEDEPKLRACVPMDKDEDKQGEDEEPSRLEVLQDEIREAKKIEVVASDGEHEIPGMAMEVHGDHPWEVTRAGLRLIVDEWLVHGPGMGSPAGASAIVGYGLFLDDEQVAWCDRDGELSLRPGVTYNLKDDVVF
jgi:hypothetical protein